MRRYWHRFRHGHWPNDRSFFWDLQRTGLATTVCRTCLIDAYRDDDRRIGGTGW